MKHKLLSMVFPFFVFAFFAVSCQKESRIAPSMEEQAISAMNNGNQPDKMLPIKGSFVTSNEVLAPGPMLRQRITGIGEMSHLGEAKFIAISTLNLTTPPPFSLSGTATFEAANGDTFLTQFTGTSTPIGNGLLSVVIYHTITGGTGRFENATGNLSGPPFIANPAIPTGSTTIEGTINY